MIILQSQDRYNDMLEFSINTGQIIWHSKQNNPDLAEHPISGHFSVLDDHLIALFRYKGFLHLLVDDDLLKFNHKTSVKLDLVEDQRILRIFQNHQSVYTLTYRLQKQSLSLEKDITPFLDAEHFDFGLFVFNVFHDDRRRNRIYRTSPE